VVTLTSPLAPLPTLAVMVVALTTVNDAAGDPPKDTAVAPVRFFPVMVISAFVAPEVGEIEI
jgi:hypothetical protein